MVDVLVVGCGPTGGAIAALLGRRGWRVLVIDRASAIYDKPRAITADHEAFRIFQEIGIADEVNDIAAPHPGTDYVDPDGQIIKRICPAPPPDVLGWPANFMFMQPDLEAALRRAVAGMGSVQVWVEHDLIDCKQDHEQVRARVRRHRDGSDVIVCARHLVAADGSASTVRTQLAARIEDLQFDEWWVVVDAWINGPVHLPERCIHYCRPSRPGTYIIGPGTLRRWEIKILPHETPEEFRRHGHVWKVLREFVDTNALEHCATTVCRFRALLVEQWRDGRILLTGDAAHEMPTFLGQGLCAGLRDAFNLAWKLDAVLRGRSGTSLLDTYCEERKFHVRRVIGHAITSGLVVGELDVHAARERAGRLGEDSRSQGTATTLQHLVPSLQVGLIARDDHGRPLSGAGELLVQPWVRVPGGPWRRLDDVLGANVAIVARSARTLRSLDEALLADWRHLDGSIAVVRPRGSIPSGSFEGVLQLEEREALLSSWLAGRRGVALVARPDRYVYGVARSDRELRAHVSRLSAAIRAR